MCFQIYRDLKQMNTRQAKISVETMKEVQNDKTLKTKGDKDRRLREKKQNNTKKFMEERKTLQVCTYRNFSSLTYERAFLCLSNFGDHLKPQIKHSREKDKLTVKHEKQKQDLIKEVNDVSKII